MKSLLLLLIIIVVGLSGCSNIESKTPTRSSEAEAALSIVSDAQGRTDAAARLDLLKALGVLEGLDDRAGRWAASNALANWHIAQREDDAAVPFSRQALALAPHISTADAMYQSNLQLGQLTQDRLLIQAALPHAEDELDRAVVHILLDNFEKAAIALARFERGAVVSRQQSAAMGFVLYRLGKQHQDQALVLQALEWYRLAADVFGVIDALFLTATLETSPDMALDYAGRALLAARQSRAAPRIAAIEIWMASQVRR